MTLASLLLSFSEPAVQEWLQQAFYPVLVAVLTLAALGLPVPEDVPLITAGVLLNTHPGIATWEGTLLAALVGVMSGDAILYMLGRSWGADVVSHRSVSWLITPRRFRRATARFRRYGMWFCFFGRFVMGVRAVMCLTAGSTRFPAWRFLLADLCGAALSIPLFVWLGYWFAGVLPTLKAYIAGVQWLVLGLLIVGVGAFVAHKMWWRRRRRETRRSSEPSRSGPVSTLEETQLTTLRETPPGQAPPPRTSSPVESDA
ncbi:MAG: DedA family protein [Planctomycetes bacterium]|nr:DedA family protein [Planctomycetota bacterium]